jgi:hypothetical protein
VLFEPEDRSADLEVKATTWSAPAIANTPRKPNKLTPTKQANGSARGMKKRAGIAASPVPPTPTLDQPVSRAIYFSLSVNVSDAGAREGAFRHITLAQCVLFAARLRRRPGKLPRKQAGERSLTNFNRFAPQIWAGAALVMKSLDVGTIFNPPNGGLH